jgi:RimJ/RimL family protein N-acetyltransferase
MRDRISRAFEALRSEGPAAFLRDALRRVVTVETYYAFAADMSVERPPLPAAIPLETRRATEEDFRRFRETEGPLRRQAAIRDRFGIDRCFLAFSEGEIAHFLWIYYPHELSLQPTRFRRLRSDEVAIANVYTFPSFRGKGIFPHMLRAFFPALRSEGYRICYLYIESDNIASQRSALKAGAERVGVSWRVRLFYHRDPAAGIYIAGPTGRPRPASADR